MDKNKDEFVRLRNDYDPENHVIIKYSKDFFTMISNVILKDKMMMILIMMAFIVYIVIAIILLLFK